MQQRSLNSHFKVKKNTREESSQESKGNAKGLVSQSEKKGKGEKSLFTDTKQLVHLTATRVKRVSRAGEDSFEEPEVVGKRVKLDKRKSKSKDNSSEEKEKNLNKQIQKINSSLNAETLTVLKSVQKSAKKKNPISQSMQLLQEESDSNSEEEVKNKNCGSKSTTYSDNPDSPKASLSAFTKSIIDQVMQQKKEKDEKTKITGDFNYLNYRQFEKEDETITPKKIPLFSGQVESNLTSLIKIPINTNLTPLNITPQKINDNKFNNFSSLKTPPAELQLSLKTLAEIEKLKTERKRVNRFERENTNERNRSESSFSLRFKYEELIKEERELLLPVHYKTLLASFVQLDNTLNLFKVTGRQGRVTNFNDVQHTIETTYKQKFDYETFYRILYVVPHLFVYKWEKVNLQDEFSLIIDIPRDYKQRIKQTYSDDSNFINLQTENYDGTVDALSKTDLEERKKVFKNILVEMTSDHHKLFLEKINYPKEFDPFRFKTWHHDYDVQTVPPIPIFEILNKPTIQITNINDFLKETDIKSTLVKRAIEEINTNNSELQQTADKRMAKPEDMNSQVENGSNLSKIFSSSFLQKIDKKEEAVQISKNIIEYSTQKNRSKNKVKEYQDLVDRIQTIFIMQKKTSIPLTDLAQKLQNSSETIKSLFTIDKLKNLILKFKELFPHWISILEHSFNGTLVKIEKVDMSQILKKISDLETINQIELIL